MGPTWWEMNPSTMDVNVFEGVLHQDSLSGICRVTWKTFCHWVDIFLDRVSNLNLVSFIGVYE